MMNFRFAIFIGLVLTMLHANAQLKHRFIASGSGMKNIVIVDKKGNIEWEYPAGKECNDVSFLSDNTVLFSCKTGAKLVSLEKELLWEYEGKAGTEVQSASMLKNGRILIIQNGSPAKLMEIDRKGKIKLEFVIPSEMTKAHAQFRNIRKTLQGTYLIGYFKEGKVCEFNKKGKLIRTIPVQGNAFSAIRLPNGNTLISCGEGHRLVEIDKDDKEVWSLEENEIPGYPLRFVANVHRLPNGNSVICNWGGHGHKKEQAQVFEITPDKQIVWELNDWTKFGTISTIQLLDVAGKMEKGELLR